MPAIPRIEFSNARFSARKRTISARACAISDSRRACARVDVIRRQRVLIEVIGRVDCQVHLADGGFVECQTRDYNSANMRCLAGCVLLLTAAAAFPQTAPKTDYLHGKPDSRHEFTVRPGVDMDVIWGPDGRACRMDLAPLPSTETLSLETVDSIVDELAPPEIRGKLIVAGGHNNNVRIWYYENVFVRGIVRGEGQDPSVVRVETASIEFDRTACAAYNNVHTIKNGTGTNYLHGPAGISEAYKVRPGVLLMAKYGEDGVALHIDLMPGAPSEGKSNPLMSLETVNGILDEVWPQAVHGARVVQGGLQSSCAGQTTLRYRDATVKLDENFCSKEMPGVIHVALDIDRPATLTNTDSPSH